MEKFKYTLKITVIMIITIVMVIPLIMVVAGSFMGKSEVISTISPVIENKNTIASWHIIPKYPTLRPYIELLLDSPIFFKRFWNTCFQVFSSIVFQLLVAVPAGWAFAQYEFKGKKILFFIYIMLMILPFQVTMVSSYIIFDKIHLMNTHFAIIISNVFPTLPVFILCKFFKGIPKSLIEAARIDGAGEFEVFRKIALPLGLPGILSVIVLDFLEYWNNIELPMTFLKDKALWPLSLYLPSISSDNLGVSFAASVIMLIPALLIFLWGQKYLEEGIIASGMKEA